MNQSKAEKLEEFFFDFLKWEDAVNKAIEHL